MMSYALKEAGGPEQTPSRAGVSLWIREQVPFLLISQLWRQRPAAKELLVLYSEV